MAPLRMFLSQQPTQYFMQREEWRITDVIKNPMVMMMILPVILIGKDRYFCTDRVMFTNIVKLSFQRWMWPKPSSSLSSLLFDPPHPTPFYVHRSPSETDEQSRSGSSTRDAAVDERSSAERRQHAGYGGNDDVHLRRWSAGADEEEEREEQQSRSRRGRRRRRRRVRVARQGNLEEKMNNYEKLSVLQSV